MFEFEKKLLVKRLKKKISDRNYRTKNKEKLRQYDMERYYKNRDYYREKGRLQWFKHKDKRIAKQKQTNLQLKYQTLHYYSDGKLQCLYCNKKGLEFLTIDHKSGGGTKHRKEIREKTGDSNFYHWLKQNNYPEGYQVLCYNCNCVKGFFGLERLLELLNIPRLLCI